MTRAFRDRWLRLLAGAVASLPFMHVIARADPIIGVDLNGRIEYSTNPFLADRANAGAARGVVTVAPFIEVNNARSQLRLGATLSHSEYSRIYDGTTDYALALNYSNALTTRLNLRGAAAFESSATGNYRPEAVSVTGIPPILPNPTDITLVGFQDRRNQFRGAIGVGYQPDPRNSWTLDYSGVVVGLPNTPLIAGVRQGEYSSISQDFGYRRTINSKLTVGASVGVNRIDYRRTSLGDSVIISPNINASMRLSSRWNASGGVGVTFLRQTTFFGRDTSRSLAANLSLCRLDTRDDFCLSGSRSVSPSSLGAARKTTSVGATYRYRVTSRDEVTFNGNFIQSDEAFLGPVSKVNFYGGGMSYKRSVNNRLALSVDAGFSQSEFARTRSDARVGVGITYHLDNRR
jgi:hypothetical protein